MTDKDKLEKIKALADKMYSRMAYLTSDTRPIRQAMDEYHQFIINEYHKEEPVSEDMEKALAREWHGYNDRGAATVDALEDNTQELAFAKGFYRGAQWQKEQDKETIELAEDHAMLAGMEKMKEQMMANAVDGVVHHFEKCGVASVHYTDPTGVPMAYFTSPEGLSAGDKVKIIVIKED